MKQPKQPEVAVPAGTTDRARVVFLAPPEFRPGANIWVGAKTPADGALELTLLQDYPDLKPVAGWHVKVGPHKYEVRTVAGRVIQCFEIVG